MAENRKLGRTADHRVAMLKNMTTSVILHGQIETTQAKAKEVKSLVDSMISLAIKEKDNFEMVDKKISRAKVDEKGNKVTEKATSKNGKEFYKVVREEVTAGSGVYKYTATISVDGVQDLVDQINNTIQDKIESVKNTATNKLAAIDTKIINRLNKVVNVFNDKFHNLNYYLQPMLFVGDDNGDLFRLSEVLAAATPVAANGNSAQLWFHPTSGTAELLAPAYMKYVEVQTIQGGKATINDTDKNNITFNGKDNALLVKFEKGVYRVIYQAVDFYGYTSTKVYYVNVN